MKQIISPIFLSISLSIFLSLFFNCKIYAQNTMLNTINFQCVGGVVINIDDTYLHIQNSSVKRKVRCESNDGPCSKSIFSYVWRDNRNIYYALGYGDAVYFVIESIKSGVVLIKYEVDKYKLTFF